LLSPPAWQATVQSLEPLGQPDTEFAIKSVLETDGGGDSSSGGPLWPSKMLKPARRREGRGAGPASAQKDAPGRAFWAGRAK